MNDPLANDPKLKNPGQGQITGVIFMIGFGGQRGVEKKKDISAECMKNSFTLETITGLKMKAK